MNLRESSEQALSFLRQAVGEVTVEPRSREIGRVLTAGDGIATVSGLPSARAQELLAFPHGIMGLAFNLDEHQIGCVLLGDDTRIAAGDTVHCTGRVVRTPVGDDLSGRVVDPLGNPLDDGPELSPVRHDPIEREAPAILGRSPVETPLATGWKSVDAMIPIGRGQRELIIGDRSTGKTTVAVDAILSQKHSNVLCFYVAIGQRASSIARFVNALREQGAMEYTTVIVADADAAPGLRYIAPYAGCTMSEYFVEQGRDTLIVYDDLTKHAQTYREISLLLRRPPGREAFPGDIFFLHSRLLERAAQLSDDLGGGSQTALPIVETQAENISAYIPTNLISITDGQIYLSPDLYQNGFLPPVDVGLSVSRVGGKTQIPAMKKMAQEMRLTYTQFLELEQFTKFGTTMDPGTRKTIEKGRRIRELLKQPSHSPLTLAEQVLLLHVASGEAIGTVPVDVVGNFEKAFLGIAKDRFTDLMQRIEEGDTPSDEDTEAIEHAAREAAKTFAEKTDDSNG